MVTIDEGLLDKTKLSEREGERCPEIDGATGQDIRYPDVEELTVGKGSTGVRRCCDFLQPSQYCLETGELLCASGRLHVSSRILAKQHPTNGMDVSQFLSAASRPQSGYGKNSTRGRAAWKKTYSSGRHIRRIPGREGPLSRPWRHEPAPVLISREESATS